MLPAVPATPHPTLELQYLLYVKGSSKDGRAGREQHRSKHWVPPLGQNRSSPRDAFFFNTKQGGMLAIFGWGLFSSITPTNR